MQSVETLINDCKQRIGGIARLRVWIQNTSQRSRAGGGLLNVHNKYVNKNNCILPVHLVVGFFFFFDCVVSYILVF